MQFAPRHPNPGSYACGVNGRYTACQPVLWLFNVDLAEAIQSVRKQAKLEFEIACI